MNEYIETDIMFDNAEELYQVTPTRTKKINVGVCGLVASLIITISSNSYSMKTQHNLLCEESIEYVVERQSSLRLNSSIGTTILSVLSEYDQARGAIADFASLGERWDGVQASAPNDCVIENARKFISSLERGNLTCCSPDCIEITPYGTVVFNIDTAMGLVSIEIGETIMGFFTDLIDGHNYASEGIETDFSEVPRQISVLLS